MNTKVENSTNAAIIDGLQYVIPFLSHQITCIWNGLDVIYEITGISLKNNPHNPIKCMSLNDNPFQSEIYLKLTDLRLILRPIKDIKQDRFIYKLYEKFGGGYANIVAFEQNFIGNIILSPLNSLPYHVVLFLIENWFDIDDLIRQKKAIDINTVNFYKA